MYSPMSKRNNCTGRHDERQYTIYLYGGNFCEVAVTTFVENGEHSYLISGYVYSPNKSILLVTKAFYTNNRIKGIKQLEKKIKELF